MLQYIPSKTKIDFLFTQLLTGTLSMILLLLSGSFYNNYIIAMCKIGPPKSCHYWFLQQNHTDLKSYFNFYSPSMLHDIPGVHCWHSVTFSKPKPLLNVPAGHLVSWSEPLGQKYPGGHSYPVTPSVGLEELAPDTHTNPASHWSVGSSNPVLGNRCEIVIHYVNKMLPFSLWQHELKLNYNVINN